MKNIPFIHYKKILILLIILFLASLLPIHTHADTCTVTAINISLGPIGNSTYNREDPPVVEWRIRTKSCKDKTLSFVMEEQTGSNTDIASANQTIQYATSESSVQFKLGEEHCRSGASSSKSCDIELLIKNGSSLLAKSSTFLDDNLKYNCPLKQGSSTYKECLNSKKFSFIGATEVDKSTTQINTMNEIPPECQDEQGNLRPGCYKLLEPIGGFIDPVFDAEKQGIGSYVNTIIRLLLAVATLLAVLMIVAGGVQYMTTDAFSQKSEGISKMTNAVLGLILAFAVYVILNTINPNILNLDPGIKSVTLELEGDTNAPLASSPYIPPQVYCPKSGGSAVLPQVIASLEGKVTYRFGGKGGPPPYTSETKMCTVPAPARLCKEFCPDNTVCLDCSGFVNYVLKCADLPTYAGGTGVMFTNAEAITSIATDGKSINNVVLKPGDIIGWKAGDGGNEIGHVLLYIGDGKVIESRGGVGREPGNALLITNLKDHSKKESLKYVKRTS